MADRISTYQIYNRGINDMMRTTTALNKTQEQISTGRRVLTPADDPVASTRIMQLDQEIASTSQYQRNSTLATSRLEQEEGKLAAIEESISRIRELTVRAGDGAYNVNDRKAIAAEVQQRVNELFSLYNTRDSSGEYMFSGFNGNTQPFTKNVGGGFTYHGDEGQRFVQIAPTTTLAAGDSGKTVFMDVEAAQNSFYAFGNPSNTAQPPASISQGFTFDQDALNDLFPDDAIIEFNSEFEIEPPARNFTIRRKSDNQILPGFNNYPFADGRPIEFAGMNVTISGQPEPGDNFIVQTRTKQSSLVTFEKLMYGLNTIQDDGDAADNIGALIDDTLINLDNASQVISETRSKIGARMNTIDSVGELHQDLKLVAQGIQSELRDLDFAQAVSTLQMQSFILEASQQSYAKTSALSLFDFIR